MHLPAPGAQGFALELIQGLPVVANAALGIDQAQNRLPQGRFPGAGLANDTQGLATLQAHSYTIDSFDRLLAPPEATLREPDSQIIHLEQIFAPRLWQCITLRLRLQKLTRIRMLGRYEQA